MIPRRIHRGVQVVRRLAVPAAATRRRLHDNGVWGYETPKEYKLPDFSAQQLENRAKQAALVRLVDSYRRHAHRSASLDPLSLTPRPPVPALDPRRYGFALSDAFLSRRPVENLSETIPPSLPDLGDEGKAWDVDGVVGMGDERGQGHRTLGQVIERLEEVYCGNLAFEYMHMPNKHEREWLAAKLESMPSLTSARYQPSSDTKKTYWELLARSERFDKWLGKKFPNVKRYGLEGGEAMMVALQRLWADTRDAGVEEVVLAMPHRGRLNLLAQMLGFDLRLLITKLKGQSEIAQHHLNEGRTGDVLSHLFLTTTLENGGPTVHLLPNPSHLEAVSPVGLGFARGLQVQTRRGEQGLGTKVISVQIHGDAAFGGQGVVSETLQLSSLPHFNVGGTVRLVVNNQLGYTTSAIQGRSSFYATDLAKSIGVPVIHVNGEHPEAVAKAVSLAFAYQQQFKKDVLVDLVVYRRWGHNELDEPTYTSPHMYRKITSLKSVPTLYQDRLLDDGVIEEADVKTLEDKVNQELDSALAEVDAGTYEVPESQYKGEWAKMKWSGPGINHDEDISPPTGFDKIKLVEIGKASVTTPEGFNVHPRLIKMHIAKRLSSLESGTNIDFATAEALAFGSLLLENNDVRLCGQDSGRGTFSQRHALIADQQVEGSSVVPLNSLPTLSKFEVVNSPLSEFAPMGFEVGMSWTNPNLLTLWEAQFGDFFNGAQIIIDTFFASSEAKWLLQSSLTLLLPHGYDGAGPEHSSSHVERFLQISSEPLKENERWTPNLHVINPTTSSQYFHSIRRQLVRQYRKPLVICSPKGILRLKEASSDLKSMETGTSWKPVLDDPHHSGQDKQSVERLVLCSGKFYYDVVKKRSQIDLMDKVAIVRIEELTPFPYSDLRTILATYPSTTSVIWAQEEPENAGPLTFIKPRLEQIHSNITYCSRIALATPATGVGSVFKREKEDLENCIFSNM